ncbi:unnamed protein product [Eruca vesicaria subsp. sativa]|uniref:MADS-box domain-containing protein n=1 Tax=Eruca vesicaria subsp. sativa TaxID=29727 RepID=A0ABC8KCJ4_ERUVS|nr:unnamed protein product [Eruca vesicaria subsp. sativa]
MARKKVKLVRIVKESARKATYNKRKKGLLKKVQEISTLCGINAGVIIYSPFSPNPEVWPPGDGIREVITQFRNVPKTERDKNTFDQQKFLKQRLAKVEALLTKQRKENKEAYLTEFMFQCLVENKRVAEIDSQYLNDLGCIIDQFDNSIDRRIEILGGSADMEMGEPSNADAATDPSEPVGTLNLGEGATAPAAAGASFFNQVPHYPPYHQQFHQPYNAPYTGLYEQSGNQNQYMDMMNRPEHMRYAPNQMGYPFMGYPHQAHPYHHYQPQQHQFFPGESSNAQQHQFFPGESSNAQQHQLFPGESSTAPPPATSGSVTPATTPNPTNNFGFP